MKPAPGSAATYHGATGSIRAARHSACSATCVPEPSSARQEDEAAGSAAASARQRSAPRRRSGPGGGGGLPRTPRGAGPTMTNSLAAIGRRSCTRPCWSSALLGVGRVGQGGVDLAVAQPLRARPAPGRATSSTAMPVSAPKACCRLRARPDSTRARSTPSRSGPAALGGLLRDGRAGEGRRRQGGDEEAAAQHRARLLRRPRRGAPVGGWHRPPAEGLPLQLH